jgi:protein associated with RNAse G/E
LDLWVSVNGNQTVLDEDELEELNLSDDLKQKVYDGLRELQEFFTQYRNSGKTKNPPD